jgi:hypothetical protein
MYLLLKYFDLARFFSGSTPQFTHEHKVLSQERPAAKHTQYFFRQKDFLHVHETLGLLRTIASASNASINICSSVSSILKLNK